MRVVVHLERYELAELLRVLEAADFDVSVIPAQPGSADDLDESEIAIAISTRGARLPAELPTRLVVGDLSIDLDTHVVQAGGTRIDLTSLEFDLLCVLVRHANQVLSKDALVDLLWPLDPVTPNAVEARISALRRKLGRGADDLIETVRGVGYVLRADVLPDEAREALLVRQQREQIRQRKVTAGRRTAAARRRAVHTASSPDTDARTR